MNGDIYDEYSQYGDAGIGASASGAMAASAGQKSQAMVTTSGAGAWRPPGTPPPDAPAPSTPTSFPVPTGMPGLAGQMQGLSNQMQGIANQSFFPAINQMTQPAKPSMQGGFTGMGGPNGAVAAGLDFDAVNKYHNSIWGQ